MFSKVLYVFLAIVSTALCSPAMAQERPVKLESTVHLVRPAEDGGQPQLVEATNVVPGDALLFTTSFRNEGANTVSDFVIVNPVPANLMLSEDAAAETEVSVDGGSEWGRLGDLTIPDNTGEERPATARDITHLRWKFSEIAPGETGNVEFSAKVR